MADGTREQQRSSWPSLATLGPMFLGATALGAGLAFYMGWSYERAYLEEWGLAFSAFSYSPYELMVASSTTLTLAISLSLGPVILALNRPAIAEFYEAASPHAERFRNSRPVLAYMLSSLVFLVGFLIWGIATENWRIVVISALSLLTVGAFAGWRLTRADQLGIRAAAGRIILVGAILGGAFFLVVVAPDRLGVNDAKGDQGDLERLPRVELVLNRSLGLETERTENGGIVTGPWRVIRVNDGRFWLVDDAEGSSSVTQIDSSEVASVTYLPNE